mmetsp:Transcript_36479/g.90006  ORF Transcript_36479/g.90006 Transcript_36479/m.90006 type:complete len:211 (+) Transcript_36479:312-944(+)
MMLRGRTIRRRKESSACPALKTAGSATTKSQRRTTAPFGTAPMATTKAGASSRTNRVEAEAAAEEAEEAAVMVRYRARMMGAWAPRSRPRHTARGGKRRTSSSGCGRRRRRSTCTWMRTCCAPPPRRTSTGTGAPSWCWPCRTSTTRSTTTTPLTLVNWATAWTSASTWLGASTWWTSRPWRSSGTRTWTCPPTASASARTSTARPRSWT